MNRFSNKQHPRGKSSGRPSNNFGPPAKNHGRGKPQKPRRPAPPSAPRPVNYEETGMEVNYLKELVDAEKPIVVVLSTGEKIRGTVRYYDRDVFSLGPADGSPKIFLRKSGIRYLYEEE